MANPSDVVGRGSMWGMVVDDVGDDVPLLGASIQEEDSVQVANESTHQMLCEMPQRSSEALTEPKFSVTILMLQAHRLLKTFRRKPLGGTNGRGE